MEAQVLDIRQIRLYKINYTTKYRLHMVTSM